MEKHLPNRLWSNTNYQSQHRYFKIHLVCYNILAQGLLEENPFLYENCFRNNLKWYKRKDRLIRELLRQDADVRRRFNRIRNDFFLIYVDFLFTRNASRSL